MSQCWRKYFSTETRSLWVVEPAIIAILHFYICDHINGGHPQQ